MNHVNFKKKSVTNPVLHCRIFVNIESKRFSIITVRTIKKIEKFNKSYICSHDTQISN